MKLYFVSRFLKHSLKYYKISSQKCGFLLIEFIGASALLMVVLVLMAHGITTFFMVRSQGLKRLEALSLAHSHIEQWLAHEEAHEKESSIVASTEKRAGNIRVKKRLMPTTQAGFILLQVLVTWISAYGFEESIELYAGKAGVS